MKPEERAALEQRVTDQVAALRQRLNELAAARGVELELSDWTTFAEVLETLETLDVEPGPFFAGGRFPVVPAEVAALRLRLAELAAARGVELELSDWTTFAEVLEAFDRLEVRPGDVFIELWPPRYRSDYRFPDPRQPGKLWRRLARQAARIRRADVGDR